MPITDIENDLIGTENQIECNFLLDDKTAEILKKYKSLVIEAVDSFDSPNKPSSHTDTLIYEANTVKRKLYTRLANLSLKALGVDNNSIT